MTTIAARQDSTFVDAHGVTIHFHVWAASEPRAVIQIVHGLGEHSLRYEALAAKLVLAGFTVYADDHRGHGATGLEQHGGNHARLGRLGPGGMRATIAAVRQFTRHIRGEHPDLPLIVLGQSWGSLMTQILINEDASDFDGVILTGTAYRTLLHTNSGDLGKRHRVAGGNGYEWLSRDVAVQEAFAADPLTFTAQGIKLFGIADSLRLVGRPARNIEHDVPVLIMIGSDDTLGGPRSAKLLADAYLKRSRLTDVKLIVYTDARHEVLNETNRDEVVADMLEWIRTRVA